MCYDPRVAEARVITVDPETFAPEALDPAVEALRAGGVVGMPTDTVYGLAVDLGRPEAVRRVLALRGAPEGRPVTVHLGDRDDLRKVVPGPLPPAAQRLVQRFWPGPLTLVLPAAGGGTTPSRRRSVAWKELWALNLRKGPAGSSMPTQCNFCRSISASRSSPGLFHVLRTGE